MSIILGISMLGAALISFPSNIYMPSIPMKALAGTNFDPVAQDQTVLVEKNGRVQITLHATDANAFDNLHLKYKVETGPTHGTLNPSLHDYTDNNVVEYTPNRDFVGTDSFTFTACDPACFEDSDFSILDVSNTANVTINVVEVSPVICNGGGGGCGGSGGTGNGTGGGGGGGGSGGSVGNITATGINGDVFLSSGNSSATADAANENILSTSSSSSSGNDNENNNLITINNNQTSSNDN